MAGVTLVISILILGGVIATIGDRLGTRIGKARLSLFGMRPKKTAVAITILTGTIIALTTLGILFATNSQLRTGVFELESIQKKLRKARRELEETQAERQRIEQERDQALQKKIEAEDSLDLTLDSLDLTRNDLKLSRARQEQTKAELSNVKQRAQAIRNEAERLQQEQQVLIQQRDQVARQIEQRNQDIAQRNTELAQRDRDIARQGAELKRQEDELQRQEDELGDQNERLSEQEEALARQTTEIAERDEQILVQREIVSSGEAQLQELQNQQEFLNKQIFFTERGLRQLRQGNVAITRREVLATRVVRVVVPEASQQAVNLLLQDANREVLAAIRPGVEEETQIIQITQSQVERLKEQLQDGREYVVRILSAGNYVQGEEQVLVFSDVVPNEIVFAKGELLASTSVTLDGESGFQQLQERIGLLIESSRFRARQSGVVSEHTVIGDDSVGTLVRFYEELQDYGGTLTLQSITSAPTYRAGPLQINLVASRNGLGLVSTDFEDSWP